MFITTIQPRVSETDGVGHINNTTIPVWFESGRDGIFRLFTPDLSFPNWRLVLVNMNIDFVKECFYGRDVEVRTQVTRIGTTSFQLLDELFQDGQLCAKGVATYVNFNFEKHAAEPISGEIREQLKKHFIDTASLDHDEM